MVGRGHMMLVGLHHCLFLIVVFAAVLLFWLVYVVGFILGT